VAHRIRALSTMVVVAAALATGCWARPKVAQWSAPPAYSYDQIWKAVLRAGAQDGFSVVSSDKDSGVASFRRQEYGGEKKDRERLLAVTVRQAGDGSANVSARVTESDFGIVAASLGGLVNEGIVKKFYATLFEELNLHDASSRTIQLSNGSY